MKGQQTTMSFIDMLSNTMSMNIGDGLSYIWNKISVLPMSVLYEILAIYVMFKLVIVFFKFVGTYDRKRKRLSEDKKALLNTNNVEPK